MRWSQGVWSEKRLIEAVNATQSFFALAYGPSGVAPEDPRGVELYFEKLEAAGMAGEKRPDLLVFRARDREAVERLVLEIGGDQVVPFTPAADRRVQAILDRAVVAIECENSLWHAARMPSWGKALDTKRIAQGKPGFPKNAVLPTIIVKDEDVGRLDSWEANHGAPIHVWHVFFDQAFGIAFNDAQDLFRTGMIARTPQTFQAPGGATTTKYIYKIYYQYAYALGVSVEEPRLRAEAIVDKNGHVLPYVAFEGGRLQLNNNVLSMLSELPKRSQSR